MEKKIVVRLNDNGLGPELLQHVFQERGYIEYDHEEHGEDGWNLWWKTSRFRTSEYTTLLAWQWINHYPNCSSITKKDCLCRNMRKMRVVHGSNVFNFCPVAFNMPNDYTKFVSEYANQSRKLKDDQKSLKMWICKPAESSRGRGIFIFKELSDLQYDCNAVVQEYIKDPLLIGGYKFDIRVYVAVASFHPLQIYVHQEGLVRFSTAKYDLDRPDNVFAHLTNTSINKFSPGYTADKDQVGQGCKWTISQLRRYFIKNNINDAAVFQRVSDIIILTLLMQADSAPTVSNCFELYGFDVLIDESLKPWLLEVNFSPSLASDCQADVISKKSMLHDLLDLISCAEFGFGLHGHGTPDQSMRIGRRGVRQHRDGNGMSAASVQSDKTLMNRRGRRGGMGGGQGRQLSSQSDGRRQIQLSDSLPGRKASLEPRVIRDSIYSPLRNGFTPNSSQPQPNVGHSSSKHLQQENGKRCKRVNSYGCLKDEDREDREEEDGSMTVRTEPIINQVDSKTSLGSNPDDNNNQPEVSESLHLALNEPSYHRYHQPTEKRNGTPMPSIYSSPNKQSGVEGLYDSTHNRSPQGVQLGDNNIPLNGADFSPGKRMSLQSHSTPLLIKRPVISSPDFSHSSTDNHHQRSNLGGNHHSTSRSEKKSTTNLFRSNLQRGRDRRESHRMPATNPGRNGIPPLCSIGKKQVGEFFLVFPFNEVTQGLSYGKLDAKLIIKEMQKQQKLADNGHIEDLDIGQHWGLKIWPPLRDTD